MPDNSGSASLDRLDRGPIVDDAPIYTRHLCAVLAIDAAGYSRLMSASETAACEAIEQARRLIEPEIAGRGGRIVSVQGDGLLAEFSSSVHAVDAALASQRALGDAGCALDFRMGIQFGDVRASGGTLQGDAINVAARLEALSPVGGVAISATVADQIAGKVVERFRPAGGYRLKNIDRPVEVWLWPPAAARRARARRAVRPLALTALSVAIIAGLASASLWNGEVQDPIGSRPRLAILPFLPASEDAGDVVLARAVSAEVGAQLAKSINLTTILADGVAAASSPTGICSRVREALDADFVLSGAVRTLGDAVRVTATVTDARTCEKIAAPGPYSAPASASGRADSAVLIASRISADVGSSATRVLYGAVDPSVLEKAPEDLSPFECLAVSFRFYDDYDGDLFDLGLQCLVHLVDENPTDTRLWSRLAHVWLGANRYDLDPPFDWAERARLAAQTALLIDKNNSDGYLARAQLAYETGEDFAIFHANAEKALSLNPNDASALAQLGTWSAYSGRWEEGLRSVERAMDLSPNHPSWWHFVFQLDAFRRGDYNQSIRFGHMVDLPDDPMVQIVLAAAYALSGLTEGAAAARERILRADPAAAKDPLTTFRKRRMEQSLIDHLARGLLAAGFADLPG